VLASLGEALWSGLVVGLVACAIVDPLFLLFCLLHGGDFVDMLGTVEVSAVAGDMIYRLLTRLPVMVIDGDVVVHLLHPIVDAYPAVYN